MRRALSSAVPRLQEAVPSQPSLPGDDEAEACTATQQLHAGVFGQLHDASAEEEREAFSYFERHRDKKYSMVDCLSFVIMEKQGIREAWAVDEDFTHAFVARPGPR